jgi:hypothetical protein
MPAVAIASPANNSIVTACQPVTFTFTTSDTSATISKVEMFQGATSVGESSAVPFTTTWKPDAVGSFTLTAQATDSQGVVAVSNPIQLTAVAPPVNQLIADGFDASGAFSLCFAGQAGRSYSIQASTNLSLGAVGWTTLGRAISINGLLQYRDTNAPGAVVRFYRAIGQ